MNIVDTSLQKAIVYSACLATKSVQQNFRDLIDNDDFNRKEGRKLPHIGKVAKPE